jgi:hypothetical protein
LGDAAIEGGGNLCCSVAIVATEPKTRFSDDSFTRNLMRSMQAKLPIFGSHLKGKMPANAIELGASHSQLRKEPPKRPQINDGFHRTTADVSGHRDAIFWQEFSEFPAISPTQWTSLDVLERYWMVGRVGIEPTTN